jgi:hypothetical protein
VCYRRSRAGSEEPVVEVIDRPVATPKLVIQFKAVKILFDRGHHRAFIVIEAEVCEDTVIGPNPAQKSKKAKPEETKKV